MKLIYKSVTFWLQSLIKCLLLLCSYILIINTHYVFAADSPESPITSQQPTFPTIEFTLILNVLVVALLITALVIFIKKRNKNNVKYILHHQYAYFDQQDNNNQLNLYKRHEKKHSLSLSIKDICEYNILLNDINISTINSEKQGVFNQISEVNLRKAFAQEQQHKMIDKRIRKLTIILIDKQSKKYVVCFYLRQGNQRQTKTNFKIVTEEVINWCWLFNKSINPNSAEPEKHTSKVNSAILPHTTNKQAAESDKKISQNHADAELISALEKLAKLQKEGYLSDEEFTHAKNKLLQDLAQQ